MLIGVVLCSVVAPTRHPALTGARLLVVTVREGERERRLVAVDTVGAGRDDTVLVATGSHAVSVARPDLPTDAVVVALVEHDLVPPLPGDGERPDARQRPATA